jgi:twinkle protein
VFGDYEKGKITVIDGLRTRLKTKNIKCVRKIDYLGEKDANDILRKYGKDAIRTCIKNACYPAVEQVKDLSEVESVDLDALPKMFTGITEIDRTLGGGIAYGQLLLLTGKRGDGKSTFMSQLVCSALQQNVNTFIYSGELPDYHVKRWLDYQLAGADYLTAREDRFGDTYYVLDNAIVDAITAWYKGRCKIFDNGFIPNDKSEMESLPDIIEKTILAYDIKLVCIDNLMTAMDTVEKQDDLYLSQSNFVGRLKKIAMQYDCAVILVAHPRKSKESFSNDDVSGSSDITNKADIVMSYARNDDDLQANSKLVITKNRLTGKLMYGKNAIPLRYSAKTKRISGGEIYKYDWVKLLPKELVQESTPTEAVQTTAFFTEINEELPF